MAIAILILVMYSVSLLYLCVYSIGQLHLTWHYLRRKSIADTSRARPQLPDELPMVTIQLPVYNERFVITRLLRAVATLDYPAEKLEIQVLDDSDDDTTEIIENVVHDLPGVSIDHIRRDERKGYKAGALAHGLAKASGEFIAIFDADFLPPTDFLYKTLPYFTDPETGVVQARWGHLNEDHSLLTKLQSFGLDAHFTVEQSGRNNAGSYINFNGTAGIWRRKAIEDAGGWQADTLTEDLDLSYRAQLQGWKFRYLENLECPAELPITIDSIRSQQFRWNKGAAETSRKILGRVIGSHASARQKIHAFFHLNNSLVFPFLLIASIMSVPLLWVKQQYPQFGPFFIAGNLFLIGFISIGIFYWVSNRQNKGLRKRSFLWRFPLFLSMSMGLAIHNSLAVMEGVLRIRSPFVRTPKFNITGQVSGAALSVYQQKTLRPVVLLELLAFLYFSAGIALGIRWNDFGLVFFHLMLAAGYFLIILYSVKQAFNEK